VPPVAIPDARKRLESVLASSPLGNESAAGIRRGNRIGAIKGVAMSQSNTAENREGAPMPQPAGRIDSLDLIRGVAILGILPVHISLFGAPSMDAHSNFEGWPDQLLSALVMLLFEGKMVTLLSILFGAGLVLQAENAEKSGRRFKPYFRRRMGVLFLIGLAHALLLFQFDILTSYAVVGLIAVCLLGVSNRAQRRIAAVCLAWCIAVILIALVLGVVFQFPDSAHTGPAEPVPEDEVFTPVEQPGVSGFQLESFFNAEHEIRVFREGGFREMVLHRSIYLVVIVLLTLFVSGWYLLYCVLLGMLLVRRGIFHRTNSRVPLFRRFLGFGLGFGLPLHAVGAGLHLSNPESIAGYCLLVLGVLPLSLSYLALLTLWAESGRALWLQGRLQAVGRMALTNYLVQSLLCGFVFYSYGFALFGLLSPVALFGVVIVIWWLLLMLSPWWLRRFQIGPVEWVWRSLTEGRRFSPPNPKPD
jgi:uncharacterized protein